MKWIRVTTLLAAALLLTGCLDIVQSVSEEEGDLQSRYRITVSKSIFHLAESFGGYASSVPDAEINQELGLDAEQIGGELPPGLDARVQEINTRYDVGLDVTVTSGESESEGAEIWLPRRSAAGLTIPLFPSQEEVSEGTESSQEADAFLAGRKYRIIISKSICPPDPTFEFETAEKERQEMAEIIELADVYLIELPLIAWLEAPGARIVVR